MPTYSGTYYDGRSSLGQSVEIILQETGLALYPSSLPEEGAAPSAAFFWEAALLKPNAFRDGPKTVLRYGDYPAQSLEVVSPGFAETIKKAYPEAVFHKNAQPVPKGHRPGLYVLGLLFLAGLALCYLFLLPAVADLLSRQLPKETEISLGEKIYTQLMEKEQVDSVRTRHAQRFLKQLSIKTDYPLQVTVVQDKTVNAFALPGGHLVIYSGLLNKLETPEELAALLGHEYAHVQEKHTLRSLARQLSSYIFLSLLFNDVAGLSGLILENADKLNSLEYSRTLEQEADTKGFFLLKANALNPKGMQRLFERLQEEDSSGSQVPTLLSTHPLTTDRLQHLKELIQQHPYTSAPASAPLQQAWRSLQQR
ncbi:M48 family metalloprotease [Nibribacter ruber]|uniref:M48 family metalloprotease n=1 Tax=Nibribacter ruber TaxID=2698458 RepID=A0A6P1NYS5_9BACT|nr:M48 family metallopeptidase [Nibribacter ruber]QHL87128.1 M48 family metalloprotease [Nibribacter ruber]